MSVTVFNFSIKLYEHSAEYAMELCDTNPEMITERNEKKCKSASCKLLTYKYATISDSEILVLSSSDEIRKKLRSYNKIKPSIKLTSNPKEMTYIFIICTMIWSFVSFKKWSIAVSIGIHTGFIIIIALIIFALCIFEGISIPHYITLINNKLYISDAMSSLKYINNINSAAFISTCFVCLAYLSITYIKLKKLNINK